MYCLGKRFPPSNKETRKEYIGRLAKTTLRIPRARAESWIGDMPRRCQGLYEGRGGWFEEGGKSGRT
jgi:hypothetical protein